MEKLRYCVNILNVFYSFYSQSNLVNIKCENKYIVSFLRKRIILRFMAATHLKRFRMRQQSVESGENKKQPKEHFASI